MNFDDRLVTVLYSPTATAHDRAVRWRQLVDLVARAGPQAGSANISRALDDIRGQRDELPEALRASAVRSIAGRPLSPDLLAIFAADTLEVAAPLLTGMEASETLRAAASTEVGRFLDAMQGSAPTSGEAMPVESGDSVTPLAPAESPASTELDSPSIEATQPPLAKRPQTKSRPAAPKPRAAAGSPLAGTVPTIDEVLARIEQLRVARQKAEVAPEPTAAPPAEPPSTTEPEPVPAPVDDPVPPRPIEVTTKAPPAAPAEIALFRWECGADGMIDWVDSAARGGLIGRSIARAEQSEGVDREVTRAFTRRSPFRDATLTVGQPAPLAGKWRISGVPAFAPVDGRFVGYRGVAHRSDALEPSMLPAAPPTLDEASLRELVHEIKTPLNAIIGFGEIIEGQYLGPAHSGYRARASEIVTQAGRLLAAIDDLDLAARLRAGGREPATGFSAFFAPIAARLQAEAHGREVMLAIENPPEDVRCALDGELAARLAERFAQAVLAAAGAGEALRLAVRGDGERCLLRMTAPRAFEGLEPAALFAVEPGGFSLRLVKGLAQIVGGGLTVGGGELELALPAAGGERLATDAAPAIAGATGEGL